MMITNNKYYIWYTNIINHRLKNPIINGYHESHHIIPKCVGGKDIKSNIVNLTAREHYICHLLLTHLFSTHTPEYKKIWKAFSLMCWYKSDTQKRNYKINSRIFEKLRTEFKKIQSLCQKGKNNSNYGTKWYHNKKLKISKKFGTCEKIPNNWEVGRIINWNKPPKPPKINKKCLSCQTMFMATNKKKFCSKKCKNKYNWATEPKMILIKKGKKEKITKRENYNAYKQIGWKIKKKMY